MEINIKSKKPDLIRSAKQLRDVLYDQDWVKKIKDFPVYYVWRGIKKEGELRYDITIIPPKMLGKEFPKTKGHEHKGNFSEIITVLEGEAFYLCQWGKAEKIDKIEVVRAKKGDWVIYPPKNNHLTINPGKKRLVMANWISEKTQNDFSLFEKFQGAGYYYTKSGWVKNKNYKSVPKLRFEKPLKNIPKNLDFLYGKNS